MTTVAGRIGKKDVAATFEEGIVIFKHKKTILNQVRSPWFVYFQRVSKRLKTCDAVFFDGDHIIEFSTDQKAIDTIRDVVTCACYIGGIDPLPWKRILNDAKKNKWDIADWQHHLEGESSESESESDDEWVPDDDESSDDESSDDEPEVKRRRVVSAQSGQDSASE